MATVDDLSVRVSASVGDFVGGMNMAESAMSDVRSDAIQTAAAMQVLQGRMDEAGDEATTAGAKAGASSGGFTALAASAATTEVSFSSLSLITATTLIPSLLALSTVIAPLTAAFASFLTVTGAIVGVGLVGFLGAAVTNSERLKSTFQTLTSTLRTQFAPAFNIFANVLDRLMKAFTAIIPQLVPAEKVIRKIAGQFEQLGMALISVLPAFTRLAVELTQRFLPPFTRWAEKVLPKVPGMLRSLVPIMLQVGKALQPLARAFIDMLPAMTKFGMRVLNIITPALTGAVRIFDRAMRAVNGLDRETAKLVTTLTILSPVIAGIATTVGTVSAPILAAAAAVGVFASAWIRGWKKTKRSISRGVSYIIRSLTSIGKWIRNNGPRLAQRAISLFQRIIRDSAAWVRTNGPPLIRKAFMLIGKGIRFVLKDIYNAVTGQGNSYIKRIVKDAAIWLKSNGPGILKGAAKLAFDGIKAAAQGLVTGLMGEKGVIKTMFSDMVSYIKNDAASDIKTAITNALEGAGKAAAEAFKNAFNAAIPSSIELPSQTIAGKEVGGGSIDLPQLNTGGYIEQGGLAQLHAGEQVVPAAEVDRDGGKSSGTTVKVDKIVASGYEEGRAALRGLNDELDSHGV